MKSAEARLCAELRKVYRDVMAESANLLVYFGDEFGEKLFAQTSTATVNSVSTPVSNNIGTFIYFFFASRFYSNVSFDLWLVIRIIVFKIEGFCVSRVVCLSMISKLHMCIDVKKDPFSSKLF